ncbi:MAG: DNA polymerase III subunit chi [Rhodoferax sp.]
MTQIAFHFGVPDKLAYTCRLLRKAVGTGARVAVLAEAAMRSRLDADLWALAPTEFVPHCHDDAEALVQELSPVLLLAEGAPAGPQRPVLVNLLDQVPASIDAYERLIEIVSTDEADRQAARARWKHYTEHGYTIVRHDVARQG